MDEDDSLDIEFISEADADQAETLDKLIGRKIWNVELLEDDTQSMIKICLSQEEDDYLLIHCEGADLYLVEPKNEGSPLKTTSCKARGKPFSCVPRG